MPAIEMRFWALEKRPNPENLLIATNFKGSKKFSKFTDKKLDLHRNTDSERNEHLKQSFIKIQNLLHEQFSNKLVGDPFVLELISELQEGGSFDCKKDMEDEVTKRARESILSSIGDCFKEKFIDFYGIDINDVFECVSNYVNKLNNDPNALKSVKVKAQMAIDVIDTAKSKN